MPPKCQVVITQMGEALARASRVGHPATTRQSERHCPPARRRRHCPDGRDAEPRFRISAIVLHPTLVRTLARHPPASLHSQKLADGLCVRPMSTSMGGAPARLATEKRDPPRRHRTSRSSRHPARNGAKATNALASARTLRGRHRWWRRRWRLRRPRERGLRFRRHAAVSPEAGISSARGRTMPQRHDANRSPQRNPARVHRELLVPLAHNKPLALLLVEPELLRR
jgi:hypothetical protein